MPTPRHRYTLVGFSEELDWRVLNFVEPIPPHRICKACGLVTRVTAFLPCLHIFCKNCYEQCRHDEGHCCPLDGQRVLEEDVEWREFPVVNVLKRKVKCWNEDHGCDIVLPASELNKHFCKDCDHHSTFCPRCSMAVRCNNVCAHMQSECRDHVMPVTSENPQTNTTGEKAKMIALNAKLDTRVGEMKERLDHLTHGNDIQSNRLNEISHCMDAVKETLREISRRTSTLGSVASSTKAIHETLNGHSEKLQQLAGTINNSQETLKEGMERSLEQLREETGNTLKAGLRELFSGESGALTDSLRKELEVATRAICSNCAESVAKIVEAKDCEKETSLCVINSEKIVALSRISVKQNEFVVEGLKELKESAFSVGYCAYEKEKTYMSGYHLSPGVSFVRQGQHVNLHLRIQLHKGMIDDVLQWPFKEKVRLTIKHPSENKEWRKEKVPADNPVHYAKPDKASNPAVYFIDCSFNLDDLEREGYVADNKLQVVLELVSGN